MSNNIENDRSLTAGKMYPIDLAPQKITIVKSMPNTEVKMAHLIPGQPKTTNASQIITHSGMGSIGAMRTATSIITPGPGVTSQPQSGSPIIHATQIVSQGSSQILSQGSQVINQTQILPSGQLLSPNTQIISQGTQLSAQVSTNNAQVSNGSSVSSTLLNVGGGLASGAGNLVVSSSVRTLPPSVRVLPPLPHHNNKPVLTSATNTGGVLVSKSVTSHVPRGLAAGASLAVRPVVNAVPSGAQGGAWSNRGARGALVYGSRPRSPAPRAAAVPHPAVPHPAAPHPAAPATTVLTSSSVISSTVRSPAPPAPTARPLPLLQRNYQPTKMVNVANVGLRGVVGNSAPPQLYYEVPRAAHPAPPPAPLSAPHAPPPAPHSTPHAPPPAPHSAPHVPPPAPHAPPAAPLQLPRLLAPYSHAPTAQVSVVSSATGAETRGAAAGAVQPRPTILRKRDVDGSPTKALPLSSGGGTWEDVGRGGGGGAGWEDVPRGGGAGSGSTTVSAASSPPPDDEPRQDMSPRKKPRKQILSNEVRQCEFPPETKSPTPPPPPPPVPPPKRPTLRGTFVCGWRGTALHFTRPAEVVRRECRRDLAAIAAQRHVLTSADGWKVHHLTAQMDDLVSLEADVGEQLTVVLQSLESSTGRGHATLKPLSHTLLELIKGNIQRSKIVCEGIQEAREDILRVFKHRNFVSEILTRQSEKRCFRKHRSMS